MARRDPTLEYERALWERGLLRVGGADEVARGCLVGPVVACCVVLPPGLDPAALAGVRDSKMLSPGARERVLPAILAHATAVGIGWSSSRRIDRIGIQKATIRALSVAIRRAGGVDHLLLDGLPLPELGLPHTAFPKADAASLSVAAASCVAKVVRDRLVHLLDRLHPGYGWNGNAGYGTADHLAAIAALGLSPVHRKSFGAAEREQILIPF